MEKAIQINESIAKSEFAAGSMTDCLVSSCFMGDICGIEHLIIPHGFGSRNGNSDTERFHRFIMSGSKDVCKNGMKRFCSEQFYI